MTTLEMFKFWFIKGLVSVAVFLGILALMFVGFAVATFVDFLKLKLRNRRKKP